MRIGILGGPECPDPLLARTVRRLGVELGRRSWAAVLGVPGPVAADAEAPGLELIEVLPRGGEPRTAATDLRVVADPCARLATVRLLSDAVVMLPGGVDVLAELLGLLGEQALGLGDKPCGVLDPAGLLDPLAEQLHALDRADLPSAPLLRAADPSVLLDELAVWRPPGADLRDEVAWLRVAGSGLALLPGPAGLRLPGGTRRPGERGRAALCRLLAASSSVRLHPERLLLVAVLVVPGPDGGWRRVRCYRVAGPQPELPGAVTHPLGEPAACDPVAAALQDLARRGQLG